ncbi:MAG: outer membrane protein transport protein [Propionivibrio sp.]|uniref:Outer membrane protein transport protein n=1 Tax=Candidatus Propionivibrio dominans TaxID=2954373 RepID=A0A9D7IHL9_9RHOO|nr:outer membrane protein transport protein [Candidatus Propionivibrio dominans]
MKHVNSMKLIPALMLVAFSGAASASGFQLLEQNASGIANAYAGSAAVADNASTIYFNPAGMTQLQAREVSGGVSAVNPSFSFDNKGSSVGAPFPNGLAGTGDGGNAGGWAFIPNGYLSWALSKDLYIGVGVGGPFGLKTEYNNPWVGAAQSVSFEVKTYNVNPSIAYRVNETVSLGLGVNWQYVDATYKRQAGVAAAALAATPVKLTLDDDAWGWNVGALFTVSPSTKVGLSYRSTIQYHTSGKIQASGPSPAINAGGSSKAKADIELPDTAILSVTQKLSDKWEMLGDVSWTGWSSIPKVDIYRSSNTGAGTGNGTVAQVLDSDFRDTWRVALGANYQYNDAWKLKFGLAYDESPVKGASTRLTSLPDNDRVWFSFGAQWAPDKASRLDLGMSYIYVQDSKINNNQTTGFGAAARGIVTGDYSASIWLFGAQYSMAF